MENETTLLATISRLRDELDVANAERAALKRRQADYDDGTVASENTVLRINSKAMIAERDTARRERDSLKRRIEDDAKKTELLRKEIESLRARLAGMAETIQGVSLLDYFYAEEMKALVLRPVENGVDDDGEDQHLPTLADLAAKGYAIVEAMLCERQKRRTGQ